MNIQCIDLLIIPFILMLLEYRRMGKNFAIFSPITVVCIAILYVYVMPILVYDGIASENYISRLTQSQYDDLTLYVRIFMYSFFIFCIFLFNKLPGRIERFRLSKNKSGFSDILDGFTIKSNNLVLVCLVLTAVFFFLELWMCDFNVSLFVLKMIKPRDYIMREGVGAFNDLIGCIRFLLMFITSIAFARKKTYKNLLLFVLAVSLNMIGGGKSSALRVCIIAYLIFHRMNKNPKKVNFFKILTVGLIFTFLVLYSFGTMRSTSEGQLTNITDIVGFIVEYDQEAYYSGRVISDFSPKLEYWLFTIESIVCTPIPRAIWSEKGYYSFFNGYWRALYQPRTIMSHTSTYGIVAEGQMLFGFLMPVVYALLFTFLAKKIYYLYYDDKPSKVFLGIMLIVELYYIVRAGLFEPSTIWTIIIYSTFVTLVTKLFDVFYGKNSYG